MRGGVLLPPIPISVPRERLRSYPLDELGSCTRIKCNGAYLLRQIPHCIDTSTLQLYSAAQNLGTILLTCRRDKPRFNPHILYTLFPSISLLCPADWEDMKNITIGNPARPRAFMFEKVLYADRSSAFYGPYTGPTSRTVASSLYVGKTTRWWWEPIRRQVLRAAGLSDDILDRNLEGLGAVDPMHFAKGEMALPKHAQPIYYPPGQIEPIVKKKGEYQDVVTYISRQGSRRHLTQESHDDLVRELEKKRQELGFELVIVQAEKLSIEEQLALAGRTTVSQYAS